MNEEGVQQQQKKVLNGYLFFFLFKKNAPEMHYTI